MFETVRAYWAAVPLPGKVLLSLVAGATSFYYLWQPPKRRSLMKSNWEKDVVYLYQFGRWKCIPNISPYCIKLETWLRIAKIKHENILCSATTRSKKGRLPFVELNGEQYADSTLIIHALKKYFRINHEDSLTDEQKGVSRMIIQATDSCLALSYLYVRYCIPENLNKTFSYEVAGFNMPLIFKLVAKPRMGSSFLKRIEGGNGVGLHTKEEIIELGLDDLRALSRCLGKKKFFNGDSAGEVDATVFGTVAQMVWVPIDTPFKRLLDSECRNLLEFCHRMKDTFWPDWDRVCQECAKN